ncbi:Condensin-2 Complex Subunit G2 [Manis pentadactyla]|nr:Condensin-2 Complex Subunit G2 [Manis pentadactyla]
MTAATTSRVQVSTQIILPWKSTVQCICRYRIGDFKTRMNNIAIHHEMGRNLPCLNLNNMTTLQKDAGVTLRHLPKQVSLAAADLRPALPWGGARRGGAKAGAPRRQGSHGAGFPQERRVH